jgi:hypothetical protein
MLNCIPLIESKAWSTTMHVLKIQQFTIETTKTLKIGFKLLIPQSHKAHLHYNINHEFIFYHFEF